MVTPIDGYDDLSGLKIWRWLTSLWKTRAPS